MTVFDSQTGAARLVQERNRLLTIIARATPVEGCGPSIPVAPARGPSRAVTPNMVMPDPKSKTGYKVEETGWRGFKAAKGLDIFDDLERRAVLRKDQDGNPGQSPFTKKQVNTARRYRDIVERHDAGGMKCASLEARLDGSSNSGGEFIDAYLAEGREIRAMQHAIGKGVALAVRRARTSARLNAKTRNIRDRDLVDAICLHGKSFRDVLKVYGWSIKGQNIALLTGALSRTLDRMGWQ